ncbi:hypothetical protein O0544_20650 [Edwardsiella anguillarum]|nr:hypothetical protein [Edwardsiella anguillarum]
MSSVQGKSPRRHKAEALGVLLPGGGIRYATDHDRDVMRAVPVGTPIALQPVGDRRNLKHHRKFLSCWRWGCSTGFRRGSLSAVRKAGSPMRWRGALPRRPPIRRCMTA